MNKNNRTGLRLDTRDYEGFKQLMIEQLKVKIPEYSDFSETDMGIVLIELLAHGLDILSFYNDKISNELFLETAMEIDSIIKLTKMLGYKMKNSTPSQFYQVFELGITNQDTIIKKGTLLQTEGDLILNFELDEDLIIPQGATGLEKDEEGNYIYAVPITQGESITGEILGQCNNIANFKILLNRFPVQENSIEIYLNEGNGFIKWEKVDNFIESTSNSQHYTVTIKDNGICEIQFGNGISGKIPNTINDGILANYRVSEGSIGNVGINTITKMPSKLADVKRTFNPNLAYVFGRDRESIEEARINAPKQLGSKWGLVTKNDFKNHALSFTGVLRSNVKINDNKVINVFYITDGLVDKELLEQQMIDSYSERKVLGTTVTIEEGKEIPINLNIYIKTFNYLENEEVKEEILTFMNNYFIKGKYDFQEIPEQSDILLDILNLFSVRSATVEFSETPTLKENELLKLGNVNIEVVGGK